MSAPLDPRERDERGSATRGLQTLEIRGLEVMFGGLKALDGVDLTLARGDALGVLGPNGSGKSTLLNCISGHDTPRAGTIHLDGVALLGRTPHEIARLSVARTFQSLELFESLTALDNIQVGRHRHLRLRRQDAGAVVARLVEALQLGPWIHHAVASLPAGVQKRVDLARALASEPRLVLVDEPSAGTSAEERQLILQTLRAARAQTQLSLIVVDHDPRFIADLCERTVVLDHGEVLAEGATAEVMARDDVRGVYLESR